MPWHPGKKQMTPRRLKIPKNYIYTLNYIFVLNCSYLWWQDTFHTKKTQIFTSKSSSYNGSATSFMLDSKEIVMVPWWMQRWAAGLGQQFMNLQATQKKI